MKNRRGEGMNVVVITILFLVFGIGTILPTPAHADDPIRAYVLAYSPGAKIHLIARERVRAAYERAGFPVTFVPLPHKRSMISVNAGVVDGDVGRLYAVQSRYPNLRQVPVPVVSLKGAAFTLRSDLTRFSKAVLENHKVGFVLGVQWAERTTRGLPVARVDTYEELVDLLLSGRIDVALGSVISMQAAIDNKGAQASEVKELEPFIVSSPLYHFINKKNAALIPKLTKVFISLHDEGFMQ